MSPIGGTEAGLATKVVVSFDHADGAALRTHHDRVSDRTTREAADAAQQITGGDTGGGEHHVAFGEVVQLVLTVQVGDAPTCGTRLLVGVAEQQPALELTADAAESRSRQNAFRSATAAHVDIDAAFRLRS